MGYSDTAVLEDSPSIDVALIPGSRSTVLLLSMHLYRTGGRVSECKGGGPDCCKKMSL